MKIGNARYESEVDFPETVPVFPLKGALLLPGGSLPLIIFEPRYLQMISDAMRCSKLIGMVQPDLSATAEDSSPPGLSQIGCLGRITACQETGDGRLLVNLSGVCRYMIIEETKTNNLYRSVRFEVFVSDLQNPTHPSGVDRKAIITAFRKYLEANGIAADWETVEETDTDTLVSALCMMSPFEPSEKQALLEAPDKKARAETLIAISEFYLAQNTSSTRLQ